MQTKNSIIWFQKRNLRKNKCEINNLTGHDFICAIGPFLLKFWRGIHVGRTVAWASSTIVAMWLCLDLELCSMSVLTELDVMLLWSPHSLSEFYLCSILDPVKTFELRVPWCAHAHLKSYFSSVHQQLYNLFMACLWVSYFDSNSSFSLYYCDWRTKYCGQFFQWGWRSFNFGILDAHCKILIYLK